MTPLLAHISKSDVRTVLAVLWSMLTGVHMFMVLTHRIPVENTRIADVVAGGMLTIEMQIISYYFGSSKNESDKQQKETT